MEKITNEMRAKLRSPLPPEAISQHPTKSFLSTIKAIYVVERLNDVFGVGAWRVKNEVMSVIDKWIVVKATMTIPAYDVEIEQFGGNDNADPGDAYKGAATDALTKIGSYLEIGIDVFKGKSTNFTPNSNIIPRAEKPANSTDKKCPRCGADMMVAKSSGKEYCSAKCWLKGQEPLPYIEQEPEPDISGIPFN